jgi:excisionase family DNA binding protein
MAELMTVEEVAQYLRVTRKTVYSLLRQDKIPATKVGQQWRFDRAAIDRWLQQRSIGRNARILVVDDEDTIRSLFEDVLGELGHRVITASDGAEGLKLVKQNEFDLVFIDLKMPGMNGAEFFQKVTAIKPNLPVIIITGYPDSDLMAQALAQGPLGVMYKPFGDQDIISAVNRFFNHD